MEESGSEEGNYPKTQFLNTINNINNESFFLGNSKNKRKRDPTRISNRITNIDNTLKSDEKILNELNVLVNWVLTSKNG